MFCHFGDNIFLITNKKPLETSGFGFLYFFYFAERNFKKGNAPVVKNGIEILALILQ